MGHDDTEGLPSQVPGNENATEMALTEIAGDSIDAQAAVG